MVQSKLILISQKLSGYLAPRLGHGFPRFFAGRVRNPIFVIGCGRSGKSLLARLLRLHLDLAYWQEANEVWDPSGYPWITSARETPPLWADPVAYTARWWRDAQPRREEIQATFGAFQSLCRRPYLLNDTALNVFRIPHLLDMFPDARFVHIVRDGREVVCWRFPKQYEKIRSDPAPYREAGLPAALVGQTAPEELLVRLAAFWRETMEEVARQDEALRLSQTGRLLELKYEELCADTSAVLARAFQFAGLDPSRWPPGGQEHLLKVLKPRWSEMLDPVQAEQVTAAMEPMLTQKGYA
jgi:hypothetical protein